MKKGKIAFDLIGGEGKTLKKVVVIPKRLVNFVVAG